MKRLLIVLALAMVLVISVLGGCAKQEKPQEPQGQEQTAGETSGPLEITLEELSKYNGKDGNPAYVAVDGIVYDVTDHPSWNEGMHGKVSAGQDISQQLKAAPHGDSKLEGLNMVGKIVE